MNKTCFNSLLFMAIFIVFASSICTDRGKLIISSPWKPQAVFRDTSRLNLETLGMKNDLIIFNADHLWTATISGQSVSGSWRLNNNDSILFMKNFNIKDSMNLNIKMLDNNFLNLWYYEQHTIGQRIKVEMKLIH